MTDALYAGGGIGLGPAPVLFEPELYPAPEVTTRDGIAGPVKRAVTDLVRYGEARGWTAVVTYSRGHVMHAKLGTPGPAPRIKLGVHLVQGPDRAVAVYTEGATWSWDSMYAWSDGVPPQRQGSITDLKRCLMNWPEVMGFVLGVWLLMLAVQAGIAWWEVKRGR